MKMRASLRPEPCLARSMIAKPVASIWRGEDRDVRRLAEGLHHRHREAEERVHLGEARRLGHEQQVARMSEATSGC